ncbi:ComF family protein [Marinoscillum sp. 108]|nr:ComF family protein [Marinoscillum sp. 108]
MNVVGIIKEYLQDFVSLIFPRICINCSTILVYQEEHICIKCRLSLPKTDYHLQNANPLKSKFVYEPKVLGVVAYLHFNKGGVAQKLVHELKYRGQQEVGIMLGEWYGYDLIKSNWPVDMIIPVPIHKSKLRKRGYNQADCFAEGLSSSMEIPVRTDLVERKKSTMSQTRKSKVERWQNVNEIYRVTNSAELQGKNLLVVDDVLTTGATLGELVVALSEGGAAGIYIATIAAGK